MGGSIVAPGASRPSATGTTSTGGRRSRESLAETGYDGVVSVEYEDPTQPPEESVVTSARVLERALATA